MKHTKIFHLTLTVVLHFLVFTQKALAVEAETLEAIPASKRIELFSSLDAAQKQAASLAFGSFLMGICAAMPPMAGAPRR